VAFQTVQEQEEQFLAELALASPEKERTDFGGGFIGGHESFGSWFTSGLTGLIGSKGASDNSQRKWFVQRNSIQFGLNQLNELIAKYEEIAKLRKLTSYERTQLAESKRRSEMLTKDLEFVFDKRGGNLDAAIDTKGQSFNERWGVDETEEGAVGALLDLFKENPSYVGGVFTAEILKDLPIAIAAYLATPVTGGTSGAAQTAKTGFNITKALNKLNNIQPKVLRGLAKMGTGVAAGAAAGAGYEAAYTGLEQGDIKGDHVKAGAAFGSAFGILAGVGIISRTAKDLKAKTPVKEVTPKEVTTYKEMVEKANVKKEEADTIVDALFPAKEIQDAKKSAHKIYTEHNKRIFPELRDGTEYSVLNLADAKKLGLPVKKDIAVQHHVKEGRSYIVWQEKKISDSFKNFYKNYEANLKDYFGSVKPRQHLFLRDENSFRAYLMAYNLSLVKQRLMPKVEAKTAERAAIKQERRTNQMAMDELDRAWNEISLEKESAADLSADAVLQEIRSRVRTPEADIPTEPPRINRATTFIEKNPKVLWTAAAAAGAGAYSLTNRETDIYGNTIGDPIRNAAAATLAVGLGPKGYRILKGQTLRQVTYKIKAEIAQGLEVSDNLIRAYEARAQHISDRLNATPAKEVDTIINDIETGKDSFKKGSPQYQLKKDIQDILEEYEKLAIEVELIGKNDKLNLKSPINKKGEIIAPFIHNYFPHLFANMSRLSEADLVKIFGTVNDKSAKFRTIKGTRDEIQKMIDDGRLPSHLKLLPASQSINLYIQGMGRAIIGRRAINSMLELDLNLNTPKGKPKLTPALLSIKEFETLKASGHFNSQEALHYSGFKHPALEGFVAHSNVHHMLNDFFLIATREGWGEMAEKLLKFNNALKRIFVFGSLFHAQALVMSAVYALGGIGAIKGITGTGNITKGFREGKGARKPVSWSDLKLGTGAFIKEAEYWMRNSPLRIGEIKRQELTVPGFGSEKALTGSLGYVGAKMQKAFDGIDWLTWDYLHNRFKLAVAMKQKEKLMYDRRGRRTLISEKDAMERAAIFANEAFGSLDFNNFATRLYKFAAENPTKVRSKAAVLAARALPVEKRRWLNLALFAPDWTISNIMIIGKLITGIPKMSKALAKRVHEGKWTDPKAQEIVRAWNAYAAYSTRAGIYTSAMWWALTEWFAEDGVEPSMEGLWDFWGGDNSGKLELGNGESMVISKQIAEPIHWLQHPMHTLMNKGSIIPKTALEAMFNKQWFSLKKGLPLGPRLVEDDGTQHYAKWILGKGIPIVTKPLIDESLPWEERWERVLTGFIGLPQYGGEYDESRYFKGY
jgi:hypothetical protein